MLTKFNTEGKQRIAWESFPVEQSGGLKRIFANHLIFLFMLASFWAVSAAAALAAQDRPNPNFELGLGINATHFRYDEELRAPLKSSEDSQFGSLLLEAKAFLPRGFILKARYEVITNIDSQFDGTNLQGTPVLSTDKLSFWTQELDLYVPLIPEFYFFAGYGNRKWDRLLIGGSIYREIYSWNFMPLGVLWNFWKSGPVSGGVEFSWRQMLDGKIKIITSEFTAGGEDSEMDLGNKPGYKLSFPTRVVVNQRFSLFFSPWYEQSEIGASNTVPNATLSPGPGTGIIEPASKTDQYGVEGIIQILL